MDKAEKPVVPSDSPEPKRDPMEELFGPGSGVFSSPDQDNDAPEELLSIFEEYAIGEHAYRCILKEQGTGANNVHIKSFSCAYPSVDWITNNCGPGDYTLLFVWRQKSDERYENGKQRMLNKSQQCHITISEKALQQWREFQFTEKIKKLKAKRQILQDAKIDRALDVDLGDLDPDAGTNNNSPVPMVDPATAGKKYVQDIMEAATMLGLGKRESGFDWAKVLGSVAPFVPVLIDYMNKQQERAQMQQQQFMTLMMSTMSGSHNQLIEIMKVNSGQGAGAKAVEEFKSMLQGAIDIKGELSGMGKESVADKVFKLLEGLAGHVVPLLMMPRIQRDADPRMQIARAYANASPDVANLKTNPAEMSKLVRGLDEFYGWEQANGILSVMGFIRPADCPCEPGFRYPPDDARNNQELAAVNAIMKAAPAPDAVESPLQPEMEDAELVE